MSRIFSIGAGKGGVGKSFITANLGVLFANQGQKVVLVDLDLGGPNLHTFLGLKNPKFGLNEFLNRTFKALEDAAAPTGVPNLSIINSMHCTMEIANLFHAQKLKIIKAIQGLPHDIILLDLGAGKTFNNLDFFLTSNQGLFILTPEPTSIENTVHFIKAAYVRVLKRILDRNVFNAIVREAVDHSRNGLIKIAELIEMIKKHDPDKGIQADDRLGELKFEFILNQFHKREDLGLGENFEKACNRHFYSMFRFLGNVGYDERVHDSILSKNIYVNKYPYTSTAMDLQNIAGKITGYGRKSILQPTKIS